MLRGHCQEAKRGEAGGHRITRNCEALGLFLLTCAITAFSLIAMRCLIGATPRGQPWTPAVTLPQGRDGLSARRMAVWWTFREPSLCRHVHREFMRNTVLDLTPIIPATACHQRNDVERYSRYMWRSVYHEIRWNVIWATTGTYFTHTAIFIRWPFRVQGTPQAPAEVNRLPLPETPAVLD